MKKQQTSGFAIVELVIVVVVLAVVAAAGYVVWQNHKANQNAANSTASYQSPATSVPAAPQVNNASDLTNAMSALNQTSVTSNNVDSTQLSTETSSF